MTVRRGHPGGKTAKVVLRRYRHSRAACRGSGCHRRMKGRACVAATAASHPRLASCNRGHRGIEAIGVNA